MAREANGGRLEPVAEGLYRFDTGYIRPRHTACYVATGEGRVAILDCGVAANVDALLAAIAEAGFARDRIDTVVVTHAHLDHAGGAGPLMQALPHATLHAHPSAAKHLIDTTRLERGVRAVYGDAFFDREYGVLVPVPAEQVAETPDGCVVHAAGRALEVLHTPGHAWHHQCIHDPATATVVAGDAFGIAYAELDGPEGPFFVPETPPSQFDPEAMHASIERILALEPARVAPTHFETIDDPATVAVQLHALVDEYVALSLWVDSAEALEARVLDAWARALARRGRAQDAPRMRELYGMDANLVAQGLWLWRGKREAA